MQINDHKQKVLESIIVSRVFVWSFVELVKLFFFFFFFFSGFTHQWGDRSQYQKFNAPLLLSQNTNVLLLLACIIPASLCGVLDINNNAFQKHKCLNASLSSQLPNGIIGHVVTPTIVILNTKIQKSIFNHVS